jgi:hypothetical protein
MLCQARAGDACLLILPLARPSGLLAACLKNLPDVPIVRRQNTELVFSFSLDRFPDVTRAVEAFCDLCDAVAGALDVDLADPGGRIALSSDMAVVTATRKIGGRTLQILIAHGTIDWALDGCDEVVASLRALTIHAESVHAFIRAAVRLVLVFLPVDHRLLTDVLGLLLRFGLEGGSGLVAPAMESALIENSGRPSMCFPCERPFTAEFPTPYATSGLIIVRVAGRVERVRGIERLRDYLKSS